MPYSLLFPNSWVIDSGATDHMASSSTHLYSQTAVSSTPIKLPTGQTASISHIGTAEPIPNLKLDNVLSVPSFQLNLLSVSKLTKSLQCSITFFPDHCVIQDLHTKRTIRVGKESGGLYYLVTQPSPTAAATHSSNVNFYLWHWRLGHPSPSILPLLSKLSYFLL